MTDNYEVFQRLLDSSIRNLAQVFFDQREEANAKFRVKAGLQQYVVRTQVFNCCEWCASLAGTYKYPDEVPAQVWQRHANCKCMVVTKTGKGSYQDAWNRQIFNTEKDARQQRIREIEFENFMSREERIAWAESQAKEKRERYNARKREIRRLIKQGI